MMVRIIVGCGLGFGLGLFVGCLSDEAGPESNLPEARPAEGAPRDRGFWDTIPWHEVNARHAFSRASETPNLRPLSGARHLPVYVRDERTGLCFAVWGGLAEIPCERLEALDAPADKTAP